MYRSDLKNQAKSDYFAFHTWGLNFEGERSMDYWRCKRDYFSLGDYNNFYHHVYTYYWNMFTLIKAAAVQAKKWAGNKQLEVRVPKIGVGEFVKHLNATYPAFTPSVYKGFLDAYKSVLVSGNGINYVLTIAPLDYGGSYTLPPKPTFYQPQPFDLRHYANVAEDLFNCSDTPGKACMLVNAWDDRSFIGNKGRQDPSIDGFFVAGWGAGKRLPNTSFLHNMQFHDYFQNSTKWLSPSQLLYGQQHAY